MPPRTLSQRQIGHANASRIATVKLRTQSLRGGEVEAMFLGQLFDLEDLGIEEGHLRINSEGGEDFSLTGLITLDGAFISAQSISRIR